MVVRFAHQCKMGKYCHIGLWFLFYAKINSTYAAEENLHWALLNHAALWHCSSAHMHPTQMQWRAIEIEFLPARISWGLTSAFGCIDQIIAPTASQWPLAGGWYGQDFFSCVDDKSFKGVWEAINKCASNDMKCLFSEEFTKFLPMVDAKIRNSSWDDVRDHVALVFGHS